jgi:DNA-binding transcriptional ArsR family regulator
MDSAPNIPRIESLLADPARARILRTLIDGTTRPAGELAFAAKISAQSASGHLAKLVEGGLLRADAQGRHCYFRLASPEVARVIESVASLDAATQPRTPRAPLPSRSTPVQFLHARTCYRHLAGEMAVRVLDAMLESRWLIPAGRDYSITVLGLERFAALDVHPAASRGVVAKACVDLTQRRPHVGGPLGDALLHAFVTHGWVQRQRRSRVVTITPEGHEGFRRHFGV